MRTLSVLVVGVVLASCGFVGGESALGWPDVDLGVPAEVYKSTAERDLHVHVFSPTSSDAEAHGAVLFFHGGGFASARIPQFQRQAALLAAENMVGLVVEYRVTSEGTSRTDAVVDGSDAVDWVRDNADALGIDPARIAVAGSSAGGALAVEASSDADALVLFNPAVGAASATFIDSQPTIVFHSRADTIVPFSSAQSFCDASTSCELIAFEEGDHGFFNDEPALSETNELMIEFLRSNEW